MALRNHKRKRAVISIPDRYLCDRVSRIEIRVYTKDNVIGSPGAVSSVTGKEIKDALPIHQVVSHFLGCIAEETCERAVSNDLQLGMRKGWGWHKPSYLIADFMRGELDEFLSGRWSRLQIEHDPKATVKMMSKGHERPDPVFVKVNFYSSQKSRIFEKKYRYSNRRDAQMEVELIEQLWKFKNSKKKKK